MLNGRSHRGEGERRRGEGWRKAVREREVREYICNIILIFSFVLSYIIVQRGGEQPGGTGGS
jgi:hypothetical protein